MVYINRLSELDGVLYTDQMDIPDEVKKYYYIIIDNYLINYCSVMIAHYEYHHAHTYLLNHVHLFMFQ